MKMKFQTTSINKGTVVNTEQGLRIATEAGEYALLTANENDEVSEVTFVDSLGNSESVVIPEELGVAVYSSSSEPKDDVA